GDQVKKGDMIASIDSSTQQNSIDNKEAQLAIYKAQLESAKVALNIAKTQFDRENALFSKNATSKQEFESAKNTFSANSAKIKELEAQIKQTNIELSTAKINLGYTKITAPRDGTVVSVQVEEGQTVNANQTTPTIVNIADLSHVKMKMQIAEGDITKIKVGTPVEYSILSEPTKKFQTTVSSIDPGLTTLSDGSYGSSSSNKSSYSSSSSSSSAVYYYAQSIVDNKDGILRIGMTTQNELLIANVEDAIIVPSIGIKKDENGTFVYVLKDGKPVKTAVKTGIKDNLDTQIISGINDGDEIITSQGSSSEIAKMIAKEHKKF
ncbi:MAG: efflux RND transporter periplasmic adaptor subunit, partial [Campylobacter concisus]|nr:efflux RND transporter periplasmic adaptor subunit [Campylobacter concisus]